MNNKAQFTLVCTCEIVMRTGETLDSSLGNRPCSDISRILLCPFHTAAPAMYEALKASLLAIPDGMTSNTSPICQQIRAALAQAEARS